ncbi:MAG: hypothetical protein BWY95_00624 [Bacteroidetes bacterium ADurb.BinA104]|nr:MAG: hypothetical protein BWY95_00624 [Bacteroidetes bacterium ADurb.BinA104]
MPTASPVEFVTVISQPSCGPLFSSSLYPLRHRLLLFVKLRFWRFLSTNVTGSVPVAGVTAIQPGCIVSLMLYSPWIRSQTSQNPFTSVVSVPTSSPVEFVTVISQPDCGPLFSSSLYPLRHRLLLFVKLRFWMSWSTSVTGSVPVAGVTAIQPGCIVSLMLYSPWIRSQTSQNPFTSVVSVPTSSPVEFVTVISQPDCGPLFSSSLYPLRHRLLLFVKLRFWMSWSTSVTGCIPVAGVTATQPGCIVSLMLYSPWIRSQTSQNPFTSVVSVPTSSPVEFVTVISQPDCGPLSSSSLYPLRQSFIIWLVKLTVPLSHPK